MKRGLVIVLLLLAVSPITAPFAVQDMVGLPGTPSVQAKKTGDDLQPVPAASPVITFAALACPGVTAVGRLQGLRVGRLHSLPLRL